jgi:hypothetical protein
MDAAHLKTHRITTDTTWVWEGDTLVIDSVRQKILDRSRRILTPTAWWNASPRRYEHASLVTVESGVYEAVDQPFKLVSGRLFEYVCQENNFAPQLMLGVLESVDRSSTIIP